MDGWSPELGVLKIAAPCSARWEEMTGDAQSRFCAHCKLNVYDLSAISADDARALLLEREGRLCVRFFRRPDGRILTQDCPKGLAARLLQRIAAVVAMVMGLLISSRGLTKQGELEPSGPPPPLPIPHAAVKTKPPDEKWIEERRSHSGPRSYPVMGVIRHQITVIRGNTPKT